MINSEIRYNNLIILINEEGGKIAWLSKRCDINPSQLSQIKNRVIQSTGNVKTVGNKLARRLERGMNKPEGWMDVQHDMESGMENTKKVSVEFKEIVLVDWEQLTKSGIDEGFSLVEGGRSVSTLKKVGVRAFALEVKGDSMENPNGRPTYPEGSVIIIDPDVEVVEGARVLASVNGTKEFTFKQYVTDGGEQYLKPLNPRYPLQVAHDLVIHGVVVQTIIDE